MLHSVTVHRRTLHRIPELHHQLPDTPPVCPLCSGTSGLHPHQPHARQSLRLFDAGQQETTAFRADCVLCP